MNGGACYVERSGHDAQPVFFLYQRTLSQWWKEKTTTIAAFFGNKEAIEEIQQFQENKRDAMIAIASALGIEMSEGSENRKKLEKLIPLNESKSLKFAEVAKIVAPEAGSLSKLSFEIGRFKDLDQKKKWRRIYVAKRILDRNPAGVRVDEFEGKQYLRTRSKKEASKDQRISLKDLEPIRTDLAIEITHAFMSKTVEKSNQEKKENDKANGTMGKTILRHMSDIKEAINAGKEQYRLPATQSVPKDRAELERIREQDRREPSNQPSDEAIEAAKSLFNENDRFSSQSVFDAPKNQPVSQPCNSTAESKRSSPSPGQETDEDDGDETDYSDDEDMLEQAEPKSESIKNARDVWRILPIDFNEVFAYGSDDEAECDTKRDGAALGS